MLNDTVSNNERNHASSRATILAPCASRVKVSKEYINRFIKFVLSLRVNRFTIQEKITFQSTIIINPLLILEDRFYSILDEDLGGARKPPLPQRVDHHR